jgi:transaldolase
LPARGAPTPSAEDAPVQALSRPPASWRAGQRLLWASTGTKNPSYSDVKYVEALIGPDTINTMPPETLEAYHDHGDPAPRLVEGADRAAKVLKELGALGIDLEEVCRRLLAEGVRKFVEPYDALHEAMDARRQP